MTRYVGRIIAALTAGLLLAGCVIPLPPYSQPIRSVSLEPLPPRPFPGEANSADPPSAGTTKAPVPASATVSCFPPAEACASLIVTAINAARIQIRVQAYSFTKPDIAAALIRAYRRGVDVRVIIDRRHAFERNGMMPELAQAGIPVLVDAVKGLAHSKVMVLDQRLVITGSYNFTSAAEFRNAENLLLISDPDLAARYLANWQSREAESR